MERREFVDWQIRITDSFSWFGTAKRNCYVVWRNKAPIVVAFLAELLPGPGRSFLANVSVMLG
jgi:hypothetical protein